MKKTQSSPPPQEDRRVSTRIFIGLVVGAVIGAFFNLWGPHPVRDWILDNLCAPIGTAFLRSLFMVVVPLVLSSLTVGVCNLGSGQNIGRLGGRLIGFYMATVLVAIFIGQALVSIIQPGAGVSPELIESSRQSFESQVAGLRERSAMVSDSLWPGLVETIIPRNIIFEFSETNMLSIIFVAVIFGLALLSIEPKKALAVQDVLSAVSEASIKIVGWIMLFAPIAVAALMITAVSQFGFEVMGSVIFYIGVVLLGYATHFFVTYSAIVRLLIRMPLKEFYRRSWPVIATAFSTSSSNATMPTTMRTLEKEFGLPKSITTFSVPLGATINMDGTALFEVVAALFIAQVFGIHIGLLGQVTLVVLILVTSIGVAGVPGGSIPILMSAMAALGIPPEGIALVLGVDRLLDMGRTVVNVTGDVLGGLYLARVEGIDLEQHLSERGDTTKMQRI